MGMAPRASDLRGPFLQHWGNWGTTIMRIVRACATIAALALCAGLTACAATQEEQGAPAPVASETSTTAPSAPAVPGPTPSGSADVDSDQPVPKVGRDGSDRTPTVSAKPAPVTGTVGYSDGVSLKITEVTFAAETAKGPGSFPGREYARITLTLKNGSSEAIDLGTVVPTLLDAAGGALPKVYAAEADVIDFSGILAPGKTATAVYAFAVPASARDSVTLVVDFDDIHTSAVFRGELS